MLEGFGSLLHQLCAGSEREAQLYGDLAAIDAAFWTEGDLRDLGFFKTPDARLRVRFNKPAHHSLTVREPPAACAAPMCLSQRIEQCHPPELRSGMANREQA